MMTLEEIGQCIDSSSDSGDLGGIERAIEALDQLAKNAGEDQAVAWYFRANANSELARLRPDFEQYQYSWEQPEFSAEIYSLRRAIKCSDFSELDQVRKCQIFTNLGNALSKVGRPIEAIAAWDRALELIPRFAMAAANRAQGLVSYSGSLYDHGHRLIYLQKAVEGYKVALGNDAIWDADYPSWVKEQFSRQLADIEEFLRQLEAESVPDLDSYELGATDEEVSLNHWRLENRLFLNPLNDLGAFSISARDIFHLPNHTYQLHEEPRFVRYFDLIKQEYVAACVCLHEGLDADDIHHADRNMLTFEHADYSVSSISIEKQKIAFRMAYSVLDKCAIFINDYYNLGKNPRSPKASFRGVWESGGQLNSALPINNWRLRGIHSISRDIYDDMAKEVASPLAVKADAVRNAAEHRFLIVYEMGKENPVPELCEAVTCAELEELAIHTLKLARATIMGLSLSVHYQENHLKEQGEDVISLPMAALPKQYD